MSKQNLIMAWSFYTNESLRDLIKAGEQALAGRTR